MSERCDAPAIFAPNGDAKRERLYRCEREAAHEGWHRSGGLCWDPAYSVDAERVARIEAASSASAA